MTDTRPISGSNLLANLGPDIIKLDMQLTRNLHLRRSARFVVRALTTMAASLGSQIIAEGIETLEEYEAVRSCGISLMQGYLFAKPTFEALPTISWLPSVSLPFLPVHAAPPLGPSLCVLPSCRNSDH